MAGQGAESLLDKSLKNIANELKDTWPDLAMHLGFEQEECDNITVVLSDGVDEQAHHMLTAWKDRYEGVDMTGDLIGALRNVGRYDLMNELGADVVDDETLDKLANSLGDAWPTLAERLGLGDSDCFRIMEANPDQVSDQARDMLSFWRERYAGGDMFRRLIETLQKMGMYDLLKKIGMEALDDRLVDVLADALKDAWPTVACHLGFDEVDCVNISEACSGGSDEEQAREMLAAFKHKYSNLVRMPRLRDALKRIGRYDLLSKIGEEVLETYILRKVAESLGESWPELALYLSFDLSECERIQEDFKEPTEQAEEMLVLWRDKFPGNNPVEFLARALIMIKREELAREHGLFQRLLKCPCGNDDPFKFRRYFSKRDDGSCRLIGLCCASCGQEWLGDRFLLQPDPFNERESVRLGFVTLKKQLEVPMENNPAFQVKGSRTKIENFDLVEDYLKVGDHITWHRPWLLWHHAIVSDVEAGRVKVIHWTKSNCGLIQIVEKWVDLWQEYGDVFRIDYADEITMVNTPELVLARARSRLGDTGYGLLGDNCEAFASYCKTGLAESCQVVWLYRKCKAVVHETLCNAVKGVLKLACDVGAKEFADEGTRAMGYMLEAETLERLGEFSNIAGVAFVLYFEGKACFWDLTEMYEKRKSGNISRQVFIADASQRLAEALIGAGLAAVLGVLGDSLGKAASAFLFPGVGPVAYMGAFLGSICLGTLGSVVGRPLGSFVGPQVGRAITWAMGTDDRAVERIEDLSPGDQVVFYGNLLHPRHHVIVVDSNPATQKVQVVHNTYQNGVVEEEVDFTHPVYKLMYDKSKCHPPDEVISRARSKIGDDAYRYSLLWNNCKDFARWCKEK